MLMSLGMMSVTVLFQGCIPEMKTDRIRQDSRVSRGEHLRGLLWKSSISQRALYVHTNRPALQDVAGDFS